ncbi:alginate biosynthesis protein Alg44 [Chthonobacter albigriseus]|uniref:alginate biosynthesis protein Alg44 n=1 Tax=Chthonobacter albigriseus TaxID=1683161 RepID=UPI0015EEA330|nr:alginate biosynthesis protein Alg44 [Chthonobacter albigriseus]
MTALVHEAQVQRQHTRYKLPLKVRFNGTVYDAADWSVGGVGVENIDLDVGTGTVHQLALCFGFEGFSLTMRANGEIRYVDRAKRRVGFRFVDMTDRQLNLIQFVVDSYLAGEIVDGGELLEVSKRDSMMAPRGGKAAAPVVETMRQKAGRIASRATSYAVIVGVMGGILAFVGSNIYDRLYIVRPSMATITGDLMVLAPQAAGQVTKVVRTGEIAAGAVAFELTDATGAVTPVMSPCDCRVLSAAVQEGAVVRPGQTVVTLVGANTEPLIAAAVDYDQLDRLSSGAEARIQYLDGVEVSVAAVRFQPAVLGAGAGVDSGNRAIIELDPGRDIDASAIGQPVNVWFDTSGSSALADGIGDVGHWLGGLFTRAVNAVRQAG